MANDSLMKQDQPVISYFGMLQALEAQGCPFFLAPEKKNTRLLLPVVVLVGLLMTQYAFGLVIVSFLPACAPWQGMLSIVCFFLVACCIVIFRILQFRQLGPIGYLRHQHCTIATLLGEQSCAAVNSLVCIGLVHELLNEPTEALEAFLLIDETLSVVSSNHRGRSLLQRAVGRVFVKLGQLTKALDMLAISVELARLEQKTPARLCNDLHTIAAVHLEMNNPEKAVEWRLAAWDVTKERGHEHDLEGARCLVKVAATYEAIGDKARAFKISEQAMSIYLRSEGGLSSSAAVARLYNQIGNLKVRMGLSGAGGSFRQAINIYRRRGVSDEDPILIALLGRADKFSSAV